MSLDSNSSAMDPTVTESRNQNLMEIQLVNNDEKMVIDGFVPTVAIGIPNPDNPREEDIIEGDEELRDFLIRQALISEGMLDDDEQGSSDEWSDESLHISSSPEDYKKHVVPRMEALARLQPTVMRYILWDPRFDQVLSTLIVFFLHQKYVNYSHIESSDLNNRSVKMRS